MTIWWEKWWNIESLNLWCHINLQSNHPLHCDLLVNTLLWFVSLPHGTFHRGGGMHNSTTLSLFFRVMLLVFYCCWCFMNILYNRVSYQKQNVSDPEKLLSTSFFFFFTFSSKCQFTIFPNRPAQPGNNAITMT